MPRTPSQSMQCQWGQTLHSCVPAKTRQVSIESVFILSFSDRDTRRTSLTVHGKKSNQTQAQAGQGEDGERTALGTHYGAVHAVEKRRVARRAVVGLGAAAAGGVLTVWFSEHGGRPGQGRREKGQEAGQRQWQAERSRRETCLLYTSPSPRDGLLSRMPSSA